MKHSPLVLLVPAILVACTMTPGTNTGSSSSSWSSSSSSLSSASTASNLPAGDFTENEDNTSGTAYVRGYAEIRQVPEPMCETDCTMYDAVLFHVTESNSEGLVQYMDLMGEDVKSGDARIGLGCKEGSIVKYENQIGNEMKAVTLSADISSAILESTAQKQIVLKITKEPIGGGRGAPACYSHFTTVELYEAPSDMLTYSDTRDGYSIMYPETWDIANDVQIPWLNRQSAATQFGAPKDVAAGTALTDASVYVEKTAAPCPQLPNPTTETHGGTTFTKGEGSDVGAGQLNETTMLTTQSGQSCYTLTLHTHSCNLGPDCGPGRGKPFDRTQLETLFDTIAGSFKML